VDSPGREHGGSSGEAESAGRTAASAWPSSSIA